MSACSLAMAPKADVQKPATKKRSYGIQHIKSNLAVEECIS